MENLIYEEKKTKNWSRDLHRESLYFDRNYPEAEFYPPFSFFFSSTIREQRRRHAPHNNFIGWKKRRKRRLCVHVGPNEACTCKTVPLFRQRESHFNLYKLHLPPLLVQENPLSREKNLTFPRKGRRVATTILSSPLQPRFFAPTSESSFRSGASRFFSSNARLRDVSGAR